MPLRLLTLLILSASLAAPALAQSIGRIAGTVTDNTGAAVVDAAVEIVNLETGEVRRVTTNTSGTYAVSPLPVGAYRVQIRKEGFKAAYAQRRSGGCELGGDRRRAARGREHDGKRYRAGAVSARSRRRPPRSATRDTRRSSSNCR